MKKTFFVLGLIFLIGSTCYGKSLRTSGPSGGACEGGQIKKAKQIKLLMENIAIGHKEIAELIEQRAELMKEKEKDLQALIEQGIGQNFHRPSGSEKMYDHIPTAHEVMTDLSPAAKFEDTRHEINRINRAIAEIQKKIKAMEKELKALK